ncbi:hypothetical protein MMC26_007588 [Xylographa opegraphella]|nr:hypothetical protein [Xylographa opegraphella]
MTVPKRAFADDGLETAAPVEKSSTTSTSVLETPNSPPLLRSASHAGAAASMTVTKRALEEDDHGEATPPAKKVNTLALPEAQDSTPDAPSTSQTGAADSETVTQHALDGNNNVTAPQHQEVNDTNALDDETLQAYLNRIVELERVIGEYEAFVHREGLLLDLPESLATIVDSRPNAAARLSSSLKRKIQMSYLKLYEEDGPHITNDDYADELMIFLPDIERLSKLADGPRFAWNVLLMLMDKARSHDPDNGFAVVDDEYMESPYDYLDQAMLGVAQARWGVSMPKTGKESKELLEDATDIAQVGRTMEAYGFEDYLVRTRLYLDEILDTIYPDKDVGKEQGGDDGAGGGTEGQTDVGHATVETAQQDQYHESGHGHGNTSAFVTREVGNLAAERIQFGDETMSMSQLMDRPEIFRSGERAPLTT